MKILSKFWNNASHPKGCMGRWMLGIMNRTHTPSAKWNLARLDWQPNWTILDIGCGGGENIKRMLQLSQQSKVYGIDISKESVNFSKRNNAKYLNTRCFVEQGSAAALPYPDETFDVVTAFETVFFWQPIEKCFEEVHRVLKSGGVFMFDSGIKGSKIQIFFEKHTEGMVLRDKIEFKKLLKAAGFGKILTENYKTKSTNYRAFK